jgi:hypothetical protein
MYKETNKTVEECKVICDADDGCKAFEYGVSHGGSKGSYQPGDCQPQSTASGIDTSGADYNLDLYVKGDSIVYQNLIN